MLTLHNHQFGRKCLASVLSTRFHKTFIVEYDASGNGIGDVLTQEESPIAFESRLIKGKYLHKAIYEKKCWQDNMHLRNVNLT